MTLCRHRSFRILAAMFFAMGMLGIADGAAAAWAVLPLSALLSAVLLPALLRGPSLTPAKVQRHVEATR